MKLKLFNTNIVIGIICYNIEEYRPKNSYIEITPFHFTIENIDINTIISIYTTLITLRLGIMIIIN